MKLRDLVNELKIPEEKLFEYALNPRNERGQHKAVVFKQALGYTQENYQTLLRKIQEAAWEAEASLGKFDQFGQRVRTNLRITGVQGQIAIVRVGWVIPLNSQQARLVTLYVVEGEV